MKLLIHLASIILISLPLVAQAKVTPEKFDVAIQNFEEKIGRDLDANEYTKMQQFLLSSAKTESSPLIKTGGRSYFGSETDIDEPTSLKMGCAQAQFGVILSFKGLLCLSEDGDVYRISSFDAGILLQINASLVFVVIANDNGIVNRVRNGSYTRFRFDGIGLSAYYIGGAQALYYKGDGESTMIMIAAGVGFGGGIQFATLESVVISKWK